MNSNEEERYKLYNEGLNDYKIAEKLGIAPSTVCAWRKRNNLPPKRIHDLQTHIKYLELYNKGLTDKEMAEYFNTSIESIYAWRRRLKLPPNPIIKTCEICGKKFKAHSSRDKYCSSCRKLDRYIRETIYFTIVRMRRDLYELLKVNYDRGIEMLNQIIEEEGEEFYNKYFGNVLEKFERGVKNEK